MRDEVDFGEGKLLNYNKALVSIMRQHDLIAPGDEEQLSKYLAMTD